MKQIIGILVVIVIVLGLVLYCNNRGTDPEIKRKVDTKSLEARFKRREKFIMSSLQKIFYP